MEAEETRVIGITRRRSSLLGVRFRSGQLKLHIDDRFHFQQEIAGVLDAPLGVGDVKLGGSIPVIAGEFGVNVRNKFVIRAVERDNALHFKIRWSRKRDLAVNQHGAKCRFRKLPGFQNFLVHALVTGIVAGLPADGVDHNRAAGFSGLGVELERAAFEPLFSAKVPCTMCSVLSTLK